VRTRPAPTLAILSAALLSVMVATPALAGSAAKAVGSVTWDGESGADPGRVSAFEVWDATPGERGNLEGDGGWYALTKLNGASMRMDVRCALVDVEAGFAEFSGKIVEATPPFTVGEVFLVSVKDSGKRGKRGDEIGMKHYSGLGMGCAKALDDDQFGRKGIITGGNIRLRAPR
jgi:hypothetical protein